MKGKPTSLDEARAAKVKATTQFEDLPVVGVGITRLSNGYGVKINLSEPIATDALPKEVDSVPIKSEVVGKIAER